MPTCREGIAAQRGRRGVASAVAEDTLWKFASAVEAAPISPAAFAAGSEA